MTDQLSTEQGRQAILRPSGNIQDLVQLGADLQVRASKRRIHNVFDDGGYKELMLLELFNLKKGGGRTGNDATDDLGREYEIKTVARINARGERKNSLSVTTEHTLTLENIDRYRKVHLWIVAVFDQAAPEVIYEIEPSRLEVKFAEWEAKLLRQEESYREGGARPHLNNPKIPLSLIARNGIAVWRAEGPQQIELPRQVSAGLEKAQQLPL
ncbi:hypothetical protein AB0J57_09160 [Streptomyces sp. NPDC049837]|uniref:hypothetical protein n=1 Tax=Streptomyces sp. NPDC049837 TaxID=3155277 RepID=UPI00342B7A17